MVTSQELMNRTISELFIQAYRDGMVTAHEKQIINQIEIDARRYGETLDLAVEDGIIDAAEKQALDDIVSDMESNAFQVAISDNILSRNETDLLQKLRKIIRKYYF